MKAKEKKARLKEIDAEMNTLMKKLDALRGEDRTDFAQGIVDKMFSEFKNGASYLKKMEKNAIEKQYVYSPFGRKRHLYATLIQDRGVQARQIRRGVNAPIQGVASEQGTEANRAIDKSFYLNESAIANMIDEEPAILRILRLVHDASYFATKYSGSLTLIHILLHEATYGSARRFKENIGVEFNIEPEIEVAISARDDKTYTWDYSAKSLVECFSSALDDAAELGTLEGTKAQALGKIFKPWRNKESRAYLQKTFPLLGVKDASKHITDALKYAKAAALKANESSASQISNA